MVHSSPDPLGARTTLQTMAGPIAIYRLERLAEMGIAGLDRLPVTIKVWLRQAQIDSWVSSEDNRFQLSRQLPICFQTGRNSTFQVVRVDAGRRYQEILGLGSSLEPTT
jgi:hypothetical protein